MKAYMDLLEEVLTKGKLKHNRTGVDTIAMEGHTFKHDMKDGFPLLTTKKIKLDSVTKELEFFIKGITDKKWLQDRDCHIWDSWCSQKRYHYQDETRLEEYKDRELGPIYGWQWRHFGAEYEGFDKSYDGKGIDQLANLLTTLKTNPNSRRMYVSAWNPTQIDEMALPPCHYGFYVNILNGKLNLTWDQRSVDVPVGLPFNIACYGKLLHLIAKESGFKEGILTGSLKDTHIYVDQVSGVKEQLKRKPFDLPEIKTENFTSIFDWRYTDSRVVNYKHHNFIKFAVAV